MVVAVMQDSNVASSTKEEVAQIRRPAGRQAPKGTFLRNYFLFPLSLATA